MQLFCNRAKGAWNDPSFWSARGKAGVPPRGLVVVRSLAGRAARAIGLALGCNGSTRLHNGACKSAGPRSSGERPSYCLGRKWTRLPRLVANEFFRGRLSDAAFQTSEANLIEFIKARGRALDREQVSNDLEIRQSPATFLSPRPKPVERGRSRLCNFLTLMCQSIP